MGAELNKGFLTSLEGGFSPILDFVTGLTLDRGPEAFFDSALSMTLGFIFSLIDFLIGVVIFLALSCVFFASAASSVLVAASPKLCTTLVLGLVSVLSTVPSVLVFMLEESSSCFVTETDVLAGGLFVKGFLSRAGDAVISRSAGDLFLGELSGVSWTRKASGLSLLSINIPPVGLSVMSPGE